MNDVIIIETSLQNKINEERLSETIALCDACGAKVSGVITQIIKKVTPSTYIGNGKAYEVKEMVESTGADIVLFDGELSPSQTNNLSDIIGAVVITRTNLILDIFAKRAKSSEGKILVELAQLEYLYPRLVGKGDALSRLGGGIGTRGPGETKLETDRRHIKTRILSLKNKLKEIEKRREEQSKHRIKNDLFTVALVGYTNTGKSTLLNRICSSFVLEKDQLFATLDPTVKVRNLFGEQVAFTDTVGFIKDLPEELLKAFKSTLDVVKKADLVLIVSAADGDYHRQNEITTSILDELKATDKRIKVLNKCDLISDSDEIYNEENVMISAKNGIGVDKLLRLVYKTIFNKNAPD